jgi:hypothetical protein
VSNLAALKARIDILDVLENIGARMRLGESWDDEVQVWCPFCEDRGSKDPAATANPIKGLMFCYQCGFGGSIIDIALKAINQARDHEDDDIFGTYGATISDAVAWLEATWPEEKEADDPWQ